MAVRRKDYPVEWNGKGTGWLDCIEELSWHKWLQVAEEKVTAGQGEEDGFYAEGVECQRTLLVDKSLNFLFCSC